MQNEKNYRKLQKYKPPIFKVIIQSNFDLIKSEIKYISRISNYC